MQKVDLKSIVGRRPYIRTINFILQKAVSELYPGKILKLDYDLPSGLYGEISGIESSDDIVFALKKKMRDIIALDIPIKEEEIRLTEAIKIFEKNGQMEKAKLARTSGRSFINIYRMGEAADTFYGPMLSSTGAVEVFDLVKYLKGFCIIYPSMENPSVVNKIVPQDKLSEVFKEHSEWCNILKVNGIGSLNEALTHGRSKELIQISEALHEHRYTEIADRIYERRGTVKIILIAGPSSSGKTTTSKRIALHARVNGMNPIIVELDNYFLNREFTPRDEKGDYNFESIYALDLPFMNKQFTQLFSGQQVEIPKFNFVKGERCFEGNKIKLGDKDILIVEGIHALNPELTSKIPDENKFRVYASALTSLSLDENNYISTSDNRLIRRIVRDNQFRGTTPEETFMRWNSVRTGEMKNIFPYQENADVMFNSALIYEFPLLKCYAEPLLKSVDPSSKTYPEAVRLLDFLACITAIVPSDIKAIPPTSVLREFIGGSSFSY